MNSRVSEDSVIFTVSSERNGRPLYDSDWRESSSSVTKEPLLKRNKEPY